MQYLYHHVPQTVEGTVLFPLNELKAKFPDMYEKEAAKYIGREHIMHQRIALLENCLWNDVLFMAAVDPQDLFDARREAGWADVQPRQYYKIDPSTLDQSKLAVYLFTPGASTKSSGIMPTDFVEYNYTDLEKYQIVPQATKDYFKLELEAGVPRIRLLYRYIPHILYKGSIDITDAEVVTIN